VSFSLTVIAASGERFAGFAPYVASVNDGGTVAFQAALRGGGSSVFTGDGDGVTQVTTLARVPTVISHPDVNGAGDTSFYAEVVGVGQAVVLVRDGELETLANTPAGFAVIGPLGPTMNQAGTVAFRGNRVRRRAGIFTGDGTSVASIAETGNEWSRFHGLPVIDDDGTVVFRADHETGIQGIYASSAGLIRSVAETGERFAGLGLFPTVNRRGAVAFAATLSDGSQGIFVADEGGVTQIADTSGAFSSFRGALIPDAGAVVLIATPRGGRLGLFAGLDPNRDRILALVDPLLGSTVSDFATNPVSVNGSGQVAIRAALTDGRELILRADPVA